MIGLGSDKNGIYKVIPHFMLLLLLMIMVLITLMVMVITMIMMRDSDGFTS